MDVIERIRAERLVAVLRRVPDLDRVVEELLEAGIHVLEVTLDSGDALDAIARLRARDGVAVLAGTVRTAADAAAAVAAGAEACVGPSFVPAVVEQCRALGTPVIPGALTPTEVDAAWMVKLFPASLGGPRYLLELSAPLADVPLMATGGIDAGNAAEFLDAGAVAVGVGSALTKAPDVGAAARALVSSLRP
jgi:2-dehydro-3-deoxyphosphogluconate aldolase/(4S)-4-hydroxy-2-oxoglutarate aldolase